MGRLKTVSVNRTHARADRPAEECVYVLGAGRVGRDVAARLAGEGPAVHLLGRSIPEDLPKGRRARRCPRTTTLAEADVDEAAAVVAGRDDAKNLLLTQLSRSWFDVDRVVVLVNDPRRTPAFEALDVEVVDAVAVLGRAVSERWSVTRD